MKVIDLLNKIANGEEIPQKIKYEDKTYIYYEAYAGYYEPEHYGEYNKRFLRYKNEQWPSVLNDEIEIIEEENIKKLSKLSWQQIGYLNCKGEERTIKEVVIDVNKQIEQIGRKVNDLIDKVISIKVD